VIYFDIKEDADPILEVGDLVVECYPKKNRVPSVPAEIVEKHNVYGLYLVLSKQITRAYSLYNVYSLSYNFISNTNMHPELSGKTISGHDWSQHGGLRFVRIQDISIKNVEF
jgi:hypothetical protein